jgi:hypothetical protein
MKKTYKAAINWLNQEPEQLVLQRENAYAMLTWRDFNQAPQPAFNFRTAAWIFILTAGVPVLILSH